DFIIFDAPPSFGLLNLNALIATEDLIVPVLADFLSFHGLKLLFETVQSLEEDLSHVLDHVFIVVNSFNNTFKLAKEALEALKKHYPEYLMPQVIRQCTKFAQASSEGRPIFLADRDSKGAQDINVLIAEVLKRLQTKPDAVTAPAASAPVPTPSIAQSA
ncbi:MAG: soj, partial [Myxococcaceae bacterium]|nr:soj [Myxococcaceae bacterium]